MSIFENTGSDVGSCIFPRHTRRNTVYKDILHSKGIQNNECTSALCTGSFTRRDRVSIVGKTVNEKMEETRDFFKQYYESINKSNSDEHTQRVEQVLEEMRENRPFDLTYDELLFGAKTSWRNAPRCPGRLHWNTLEIMDARHVTTAKEMFDQICEFLRFSINNGDIKSTMLFFPQKTDSEKEYRIWNEKLIGYAGYELENDTFKGDIQNVEFTKICNNFGWKGKGTDFDVLPLILQANGEEAEIFELPEDLILEVKISHPNYDFESLNFKYYAISSSSSLMVDIAGCQFTAVPIISKYSCFEIGRAFTDSNRFNKLKDIAQKIALDLSSNLSLWKDKALIEINYAVLYSFEKHDVCIVDHHTVSEEFRKFYELEYQVRGGCPADKVWIDSQVNCCLDDAFHLEMINYKLRPSIEYQIPAWKIKFARLLLNN